MEEEAFEEDEEDGYGHDDDDYLQVTLVRCSSVYASRTCDGGALIFDCRLRSFCIHKLLLLPVDSARPLQIRFSKVHLYCNPLTLLWLFMHGLPVDSESKQSPVHCLAGHS